MNQLYINGVEVPLDDEFGIDYVKEIADIENPDQRRSDYSKPIKIVGTKVVNKLFNHIYDINVDSTFNPQKKADAVYYQDTIEQLRGFFRLVSIEVDNDVIIYNGTLHGELSNIFKDMGDSLISDLDWTDLDHTYNETAIRNSWAGLFGAPGAGFFYPMVDYKGYANPSVLGVEDFRPGVWYIDIWDRIFAAYGYTYSGTFLDPLLSDFRSLLMPAKSEVITLTTQAITDRSFDVGLTADWVYPQDSNARTLWVAFDNDSTLGHYNTINNDYGTGGSTVGRWTCANSGTYVANINMQCQAEWLGPAFVMHPGYGSQIVNYKLRLVRLRGGDTTRMLDILVEDIFPGTIWATTINTGDRTTGQSIVNTQSFEVLEGDQIYLTIEDIPRGVDQAFYDVPELFAAVVLSTSTWGMEYNDNELADGDPVSISTTIPILKQRDFVMGVIKAFNLYVEQTSEKNLLVEARDDYYTDSVVDWTNKKNGGIKIEPNKQLQGKRYDFKFEKENDYLHNRYLDNTGADYGDLLLAFDNDFKTETKEIKLPFGSTLITHLEDTNDRPVASLFYEALYPNSVEGASKPRMVFYPGMLPCSSWTFATGITGAEVSYPYVGDTVTPYGVLSSNTKIPSVLNFQRPYQVFYDGNPGGAGKTVAYGGRNLYSQYEQMIEDIQNPVVSCKMFLSVMDIYNLSFRDKYFIDTAYFRLLKVSKVGDFYDCEFLKIE